VSDARWPLSPRAARVFYGVADAWVPQHDGEWRDVVAALGGQLRDTASRRRLEWLLWLVEWSPRFALRSMRGFSWMERSERRAWLERAERCRMRRVRDASRTLRRLVDASDAAARASAAPPPTQQGERAERRA